MLHQRGLRHLCLLPCTSSFFAERETNCSGSGAEEKRPSRGREPVRPLLVDLGIFGDLLTRINAELVGIHTVVIAHLDSPLLKSADPLRSMHEIHQPCPSRAKARDRAELRPRGLRYSLPNRTRSPGGHDRSRPATGRWMPGPIATRARYARQSMLPEYGPR